MRWKGSGYGGATNVCEIEYITEKYIETTRNVDLKTDIS